jgi:hypothetical protein
MKALVWHGKEVLSEMRTRVRALPSAPTSVTQTAAIGTPGFDMQQMPPLDVG